MIELGNILRKAGLTVAEYPGWRTRGHSGTFAPLGGVWHHTGGLNALGVVVDGRADLAGPLCNLYLDRAGVWHIISAGVAWHAGAGHGQVLLDVRAGISPKGFAADLGLLDDYDAGNHYWLGVEVEAMGDGSPYPDVQVAALVRGSAALCRELHWTEHNWVHHREWTARKVDMDLAAHTDLRALVAAELNPAAAVPPVVTTDSKEEPVVIITTPAGPDHRGAAVLTPSPSGPLARYLSQNEWRALSRLHDANPAAVIIEERPVIEHDYLTGGPKK